MLKTGPLKIVKMVNFDHGTLRYVCNVYVLHQGYNDDYSASVTVLYLRAYAAVYLPFHL
jgi:hypothetical protein